MQSIEVVAICTSNHCSSLPLKSKEDRIWEISGLILLKFRNYIQSVI